MLQIVRCESFAPSGSSAVVVRRFAEGRCHFAPASLAPAAIASAVSLVRERRDGA